MYYLQFSLQAAGQESFRYIFVQRQQGDIADVKSKVMKMVASIKHLQDSVSV
jgi:hypothetical protein